ncbi:MAG: DUF3078 domain-containing protein [Flavobacteriales bacterium]|nr:DUF3078 domain-containing protein [Flavobacteriales bacterium]MCB9336187.1 DUF3078 domain-containing protein [Flavobacteriales bacterium]
MKYILTSTFCLLITFCAFSQTTEAEEHLKKQRKDSLDGWRTGGVISINFTQVSLTNWSAGGDNSISLNGLTSLFANLKVGKSTWDNSLDLGYGILKQGDAGLRKTDDKIDFMSKYGYKAFKNWYYAGLVNFKSQMAPGYNYPDDSTVISKFMAPGYVLGAIGLDYKPSNAFTLFISPLTTKMTIVADETLANAGAFGVEAAEYDDFGKLVTKGKMFRTEYGGYLRAIVNADIMKNIKLQSKLELFSNYAEEPDHIDVNWETLIALKVNDYISATINTQLIYDHDIDIAVDENGDDIIDAVGPRVQFKEVLGIGFTYKF